MADVPTLRNRVNTLRRLIERQEKLGNDSLVEELRNEIRNTESQIQYQLRNPPPPPPVRPYRPYNR